MFPTHLPYCIFYLFFYLFYHDLINYLLLFKLVSTPKMIFLHWIMIPLIDFLRSSLDVTFSHGIFNSFACTKNFIIVTFYFFNPLLGHKILFLGTLVDASFCTLKYPQSLSESLNMLHFWLYASVFFSLFSIYLAMVVFTLFVYWVAVCTLSCSHCCCIAMHVVWKILIMTILKRFFYVLSLACMYLPSTLIGSVNSF